MNGGVCSNQLERELSKVDKVRNILPISHKRQVLSSVWVSSQLNFFSRHHDGKEEDKQLF